MTVTLDSQRAIRAVTSDMLPIEPLAAPLVSVVPAQIAVARALGLCGHGDDVPGYVQFWLNAPTDAKAVQIRWKAEAAAGIGGFGGGAPPEVSLALRKGQPAQLSLMDGGAVVADAKVKGTSDGKGAMVATLTGNCLHPNGKLYMMLLNKGGKGAITQLSSNVLAATEGEIGVQTCTKGP